MHNGVNLSPCIDRHTLPSVYRTLMTRMSPSCLSTVLATVIVAVFTVAAPLYAQRDTLTQTVRGTVADGVTAAPLSGITVRLIGPDSAVRGAYTDTKGRFKVQRIPVGRYVVTAQGVGREPVRIDNVLVTSGKEVVLTLAMNETFVTSDQVTVTASRNDDVMITNSEMAVVSARAFNVEDTKRYAGALGDPSRMAANFAGVVGANDSRNDIVVRGNSPAGMLWQMEGMNIPNPNHFGATGTTGGPVSMLNNNVLGKSDFFTSAFPANYGNAVSGAFDLRMRDGNNEQWEYTAMMGFNGIEAGVEGPMGNGGSVLVNYRYSTLALFNLIGIDAGTGGAVPKYEDVNARLVLPLGDKATLTWFATAGRSNIDFLAADIDTTKRNFYGDPNQDLRVKYGSFWSGLRYDQVLGESTSASITVGASGSTEDNTIDTLDWSTRKSARNTEVSSNNLTFSSVGQVRHKVSSATTLIGGFLVDARNYRIAVRTDMGTPLERDRRRFDSTAVLSQAYASIRHRFTERLFTTAGLHAQHYTMGDAMAFGPRLGLQYNVTDDIALTAGYGLHAQSQPITTYTLLTIENGMPVATNGNLGFTKAHHAVAGFEWIPSATLRFKLEGYQQRLFDVPVTIAPSSYSGLNGGNNFAPDNRDSLTNTGSGSNVGVEFTGERFFSDGWYALTTVSLFDSRYKGSDGVERNTAFNTGYAANLLVGNEWQVGGDFTLIASARVSVLGGRYLTPLDQAASQAAAEAVFAEDRAFSERQTPYFRADVRLGFRWELGASTMEFTVDIQNVTDHQNIFLQQYNPRTNTIATEYQQGFFVIPTFRWTL